MTVRVDVQNATDDDTAPDASDVESWVARAVGASGTGRDAEVSVRIVDASEIQALNRDYRGKDRPTNVLSFPVGEVAGLPADVPRLLGDIVICADVVRDEAAEQGKLVTNHWAHMLVHGTLHLLGHDHETDAEAVEMEALDSESTEQVGAYIETRVGKKYHWTKGVDTAVKDYMKAYSTWAYTKQSMDAWARLVRQRLDEAHGRVADVKND